MFSILYIFNSWAVLALRLVLGAIFIIHGFPKLKNMRQTIQGFNSMGFRPGFFWAPLVAVVESFGGLAILLGFFTQIPAALLAGEFLVINVWKISKWQKFVGGFEFDLLILAANLILLTQGGGNFSLDRFFFLNY